MQTRSGIKNFLSNNFIILIILAVLLIGFYLLSPLNQNLTQQERDIISFTQTAKNPVPYLKNTFGLKINIFSVVYKESPRALALDPNGILFASITKSGLVAAFPDKNKNGMADEVIYVLENLNKPHGIVFHGGYLYVAETDKVTRYKYDPQTLKTSDPQKLFDLPSGGGHFTRTIRIFDNKLYTSIGSSCDSCIEQDPRRAAIFVSDLDGQNFRKFAGGLRNTVFFAFDSRGNLWGADMGRDDIGDYLPPDEINLVREGKNYGWPCFFWQGTKDVNFIPEQPFDCGITEGSIFDLRAHVAPLGLTFISSKLLPEKNQGDLLMALHGSGNTDRQVGYKIILINIKDNQVVNSEDFITGWYQRDLGWLGRPVDLIFSKDKETLYISDDDSNLIYAVTK